MAVHVEILVEEPSMENFLRAILPGILPDGYALNENCFIRPHEGKSDLKKSIPKKVKVLRNIRGAKLIIIHDQDSNDCIKLKNELNNLVKGISEEIPLLIRIACRELENWYLGDLAAVEKIFPKSKASKYEGKAKFRNVDSLFGSKEMEKFSINFSKGLTSRTIPHEMNLDNNNSKSFNKFLTGIKNFLN